MLWIAYIIAALFFLLGAACVVLVVLQLPGSWIMLALATIIEVADGLYLTDENQPTFAVWLLLACAGLAALGEVFEFAFSAYGAKKGGASKRGTWGAIIGGVLGAIVLTPVIPIPILGTLIGAIIGTFAGAVIAETTGIEKKTYRDSIKPATGASVGRVLGTASKLPLAVAIWLTLTVAAFLPGF